MFSFHELQSEVPPMEGSPCPADHQPRLLCSEQIVPEELRASCRRWRTNWRRNSTNGELAPPAPQVPFPNPARRHPTASQEHEVYSERENQHHVFQGEHHRAGHESSTCWIFHGGLDSRNPHWSRFVWCQRWWLKCQPLFSRNNNGQRICWTQFLNKRLTRNVLFHTNELPFPNEMHAYSHK